jgi:DNA invertase Pin-like site-specific DNA recombinase
MKAWIYARSIRDDGNELNNQIEQLKAYAQYKSYQIVGESQDVCSSKNINFYGLNMAKVAADEGRIDALLVINMSRIGIDIIQSLKFMEMMNKNGVRIIGLDEPDAPNIPDIKRLITYFESIYNRTKMNTLLPNKVTSGGAL